VPQTKVALDYQRCDPSSCEEGVCAAALVCKKKVLKQEKPGEMPDLYPAMCLGCTDCISECPNEAIRIMR